MYYIMLLVLLLYAIIVYKRVVVSAFVSEMDHLTGWITLHPASHLNGSPRWMRRRQIRLHFVIRARKIIYIRVTVLLYR